MRIADWERLALVIGERKRRERELGMKGEKAIEVLELDVAHMMGIKLIGEDGEEWPGYEEWRRMCG